MNTGSAKTLIIMAVLAVLGLTDGTVAAVPAGASATMQRWTAHGPEAATRPSLCPLESAKGLGPASCTQGTLCGQSRLSFMGSDFDSCLVTPGHWVQYWELQGTAGDAVTIDLSSTDFDTILRLYDPNQALAAENDDGPGLGTSSRIEHTLNSTGTWTFQASSYGQFDAGEVFPYNFSLTCNGDPNLPPAAPSNLTAEVGDFLGTPVVELNWRDNSDTRVCGASNEATILTGRPYLARPS